MGRMAEVGVIQVPRVRWGGRWAAALGRLAGRLGPDQDSEWHELSEYAGTSAYQVARALNLGSEIPEAPAGKKWEFGSRREKSGKSTLLVRTVDL